MRRRRRVFHPVLFALLPVLAMFAGAWGWMPPETLIRPTLILLALTLLAWWLCGKLAGDAARGALFVSALLFSLFAYGDVSVWLGRMTFLAQWLVLSFVIGLLAAWINAAKGWRSKPFRAWMITFALTTGLGLLAAKLAADRVLLAFGWTLICVLFATRLFRLERPEAFTTTFHVAGLVLVAIPAWTVAAAFLAIRRDAQHVPSLAFAAPVSAENRPDVIVLILDGYARGDVLGDLFGFSNQAFLDELRRRGFFVAERSRANYWQTEQAIASALNLDYIHRVMPSIPTDAHQRGPLRELISRSAMREFLGRRGYRYVPVSSGFHAFNQSEGEWGNPSGLTLAETGLFHRTPDRGFRVVARIAHSQHRDRILTAFEALGQVRETSEPVFAVAHILAPHPPFVFDHAGQPVEPDRYYGLWDCHFFIEGLNAKLEYMTEYPKQVQAVNSMVLEAVDRLLASSQEPPVIVVFGDHGSRMRVHQEDLDRTDPSEAYKSLLAVLAPERVLQRMTPEMTPVNTLRTVIAELFHADLPPRQDRSIYSKWSRPYDFVDVTAKVETRVEPKPVVGNPAPD